MEGPYSKLLQEKDYDKRRRKKGKSAPKNSVISNNKNPYLKKNVNGDVSQKTTSSSSNHQPLMSHVSSTIPNGSATINSSRSSTSSTYSSSYKNNSYYSTLYTTPTSAGPYSMMNSNSIADCLASTQRTSNIYVPSVNESTRPPLPPQKQTTTSCSRTNVLGANSYPPLIDLGAGRVMLDTNASTRVLPFTPGKRRMTGYSGLKKGVVYRRTKKGYSYSPNYRISETSPFPGNNSPGGATIILDKNAVTMDVNQSSSTTSTSSTYNTDIAHKNKDNSMSTSCTSYPNKDNNQSSITTSTSSTYNSDIAHKNKNNSMSTSCTSYPYKDNNQSSITTSTSSTYNSDIVHKNQNNSMSTSCTSYPYKDNNCTSLIVKPNQQSMSHVDVTDEDFAMIDLSVYDDHINDSAVCDLSLYENHNNDSAVCDLSNELTNETTTGSLKSDADELETLDVIDLSQELSNDGSNNVSLEVTQEQQPSKSTSIAIGQIFQDCNVPKHAQFNLDRLKSMKELQVSFDKVYEANKTWQSSLPFDVRVFEEQHIRKDFDITLACHPVNKAGKMKDEQPFVWFCKETYPPKDKFCGKGFSDLSSELGNAASGQGFNIALRTDYRSNNANTISKKFVCSCTADYESKAREDLDRSKLRHVSRHNDRKNNRPDGRSGPRKQYSSRMIETKNCPFFFLVGVSERGFYVRPGIGCRTHKYHNQKHLKDVNYKARNMSEKDKKDQIIFGRASLMTSHMRNIYFEKCSRMFSLASYAYLTRCKRDLGEVDDTGNKTSSDKLIAYLLKKEYNFVILADKIHPITKKHSLVSDCCVDSMRLTDSVDYKNLEEEDSKKAVKYAKEHRLEYGLKDSQKLLIAIAWVVPGEERMFSLYPRVLYMDTFKQSNKEERPLFTCTGKTTGSKMFTILRVFMPNEQAWIFRWILREVFPVVFSKDLLLKVRVIVSDGDASEFGQIDSAIGDFINNATRIRCVWHVVDRSWYHNGPKTKKGWTKDMKLSYKEIKSNTMNWCYSWFKQGCYTEEAFKVSVHLLMLFLNLDVHKEKVTPEYPEDVKDLVRRYVFPHHDRCVFYSRKLLDHHDDNSNSCHEGTNASFVLGAAPSLPSSNIDTAGANMSCNANRKVAELQKINQEDEHSTRVDLKEIGLLCIKGIIRKGIELFLNEWRVRFKYKHIRFSGSTFLVTNIDNNGDVYQPKNRKAKYKGKHPAFIWTHTVYVSNHVFNCSCGHFERHGYPCRHVIHLLVSLVPDWKPSHHDFKVRWWDVYQTYVNTIDKSNSVANLYDTLLSSLSENDAIGVVCENCDTEQLSVCNSCPALPFRRDILRCANYDLRTLDLKKIMGSTLTGLEQKFFINEKNKDYTKKGNVNVNDELISQLSQAHEEVESMFSSSKTATGKSSTSSTNNDTDETLGSAYQTYMPVFKDLISVMEFNTDRKLEDDIVTQCNKWMAQIRAKTQKSHEMNGEFVSICPAFSRRKKKQSFYKTKPPSKAHKKTSTAKHSHKSKETTIHSSKSKETTKHSHKSKETTIHSSKSKKTTIHSSKSKETTIHSSKSKK